MGKLPIGTFLDEVKEEIKHAPKMFHQLQKRDELIKELRAENTKLRDFLRGVVDAHEATKPPDPSDAYYEQGRIALLKKVLRGE